MSRSTKRNTAGNRSNNNKENRKKSTGRNNNNGVASFVTEVKNKGKLGRLIVLIILLAFFVVLLFNLFSCTRNADVDDKTISDNKKSINQIQDVDVAVIEAAVQTLDAASGLDETDSLRIKYRRMFSTSIIIGDSLTEGLTVYNWLDEGNVMAAVGGSILTSGDSFNAAAAAKPRCVFFAFGMNDMGNFACDAAAFRAEYTTVIKNFKSASPDTKIFVNSISTPTAEAQAENGSIAHYQEFNAAIQEMCKELKVTYIDITDILPSHPELYAGDGIHADPDYYPLWMDRMAERAGLNV